MYKKYSILFALLTFPVMASAATAFTIISDIEHILSLMGPFLVSIAVFFFMWGVVKFIAHAGDEKAVADGKMFMIWGMVGLFVIVSIWGIVGFIQDSLIPSGGPSMSAPNI